MISDTWIESARYLTTLLMNDRQQINSKHRQTLSFGDYNTSLPTSKQSDTASPFMVLLGQVVLTSLISHYPVPLPQQDRDLLFSRQHWWIRYLTAPRKPSAKLWDAERTVCLWVVVVTSKPQCPLVQSNGVSWTIRLSDQCEASFFFPAAQGAPCFSQHLIVINLSGMAVRWKWRNGLPITASLLSDCLVNEGLSAGLTAPQHTGFSLGGKKPVLKCVLKIRKGSKVTHFFFIYHPSRGVLTCVLAFLGSTIGGKATLRFAFYSEDLTCFVLLIEVLTAQKRVHSILHTEKGQREICLWLPLKCLKHANGERIKTPVGMSSFFLLFPK